MRDPTEEPTDRRPGAQCIWGVHPHRLHKCTLGRKIYIRGHVVQPTALGPARIWPPLSRRVRVTERSSQLQDGERHVPHPDPMGSLISTTFGGGIIDLTGGEPHRHSEMQWPRVPAVTFLECLFHASRGQLRKPAWKDQEHQELVMVQVEGGEGRSAPPHKFN